MWEQIDPEIIEASKAIAETGKYDDAIFAAFRLVEAKIQERIQSSKIGESLIAEAFDGVPPRIFISPDQRDQSGIRQIFSGAMANVRNDRGHKKSPLTPCRNAGVCAVYLSFATFLLHLLNQDKGIFPRVDAVNVFGTDSEPRAELRGVNFKGSDIKVTAGSSPVAIVRKDPSAIEVILPAKFCGDIVIEVDARVSAPAFCDASFFANKPGLIFEVVAADVPLYSDAEGCNRRTDVVGLLVRSGHSARPQTQIMPTLAHKYMAGNYVTYGSFDYNGVGETWYLDSATRRINYAWTSAAIASPTVIGPSGAFRLGGISIAPPSVETQLGESRYLTVLGSGRDGDVPREHDVTARVKWTSLDPSVAFVNRGTLIPKKLGRVRVECELEKFVSTVEVSVEHLVRGHRTLFFQGLRDVQHIRFDSQDNLYLCNAGPSVFRLSKSGEFSEVFRISQNPLAAAGIDCLAIDTANNLYINDVSKQAAYKCAWDGTRFGSPTEIATSVKSAKKGIAVTSQGDVFVAVVGPVPGTGWIVKVTPSGEEKSIALNATPFFIGAGPDGNIYVPVTSAPLLLIFNSDLELIDQIQGVGQDMAHDICISPQGSIFLPGYHSGVVLKLDRRQGSWQRDQLAHKYPGASGVAIDSCGRLFVANSASGSIDVLY